MADVTINVTVTVDRDGTFHYKINNQTASQPLSIQVGSDDTATIPLTVEPGTPGDSVVFSSTPISFPNGNTLGIEVGPGSTTTTTTLTDHNTVATSSPEEESFLIHVIYTQSGGSPQAMTSPDPTIINTGTGGERTWTFPPSKGIEVKAA